MILSMVGCFLVNSKAEKYSPEGWRRCSKHMKTSKGTIDFDHFNRFHNKSLDACQSRFGGTVRGRKGDYVVELCEKIMRNVWENPLGQNSKDLLIEREKSFVVPTKRGYVPTDIDLSVSVNQNGNWTLVMCPEVKSYIEATMLKRTLMDAIDIHKSTGGKVRHFPIFVLERCVRDEVVLGAEDMLQTITNDSTARLQLFPVCEGNRAAQKEIHEAAYRKPLFRPYVEAFTSYINDVLTPYAKQTSQS